MSDLVIATAGAVVMFIAFVGAYIGMHARSDRGDQDVVRGSAVRNSGVAPAVSPEQRRSA